MIPARMIRKAAGKFNAKNSMTENPPTAFTNGLLTPPHQSIGIPPYRGAHLPSHRLQEPCWPLLIESRRIAYSRCSGQRWSSEESCPMGEWFLGEREGFLRSLS